MVDNKDKQDLPVQAGEIKNPEQIIPSGEQAVHFDRGPLGTPEKVPEKREVSQDDERVLAELRREIKMMELDPSTKKDAEIEREKIEYLGQKEKLEHLLQIAREKGIVFAVHIASKMGDASIVDTLHDILAQEGFYLKMGKPTDDDDKKT